MDGSFSEVILMLIVVLLLLVLWKIERTRV